MALTFPSSPTENQQYDYGQIVYTFDGIKWTAETVIITSSSGGTGSSPEGSSVTINDNSPISPTAGDLWWNSDDGRLKIYYDDGSSSQWVDTSPAGMIQASDVDTHLNTNTATSNQVLSWNGSDYTWVAQSGGSFDGAFSSLTGIPTTIAGYGITDAFDGAYASLTGAPTIPSALTDLSITDGTSGQVLTTDGTGNFTFTTVSGGSYADADVDTHLNTSAATSNQVLSWNGSDYAWVAQSGDATPVNQYRITIPASSVSGASDLSNFPVMIDLSLLPASFFKSVRYDGGNIRAFASDGSTQLPLDIIDIHKYSRAGSAWVKVPTLSATNTNTIVLKVLSQSNTLEAENSTYGSLAVWNDYTAVFLGGGSIRSNSVTDTTWTSTGSSNSTPTFEHYYTSPRFADDFHQGIAWDSTTGNMVCINNNLLVLYDTDWNEITRNSNPCGDVNALTGLSLGHTCDGTIVGEFFILPINNYPTNTQITISVFDKTTLEHIYSTVISDPQISGICWNPEIEKLVTCSWGNSGVDFTQMYVYDLNTITGEVTYNTAIVLQPESGSTNIVTAQGIEYWQGRYWISDDARSNILPVSLTGKFHRDNGVAYSTIVDNSNFEGITVYRDGLAVLIDPFDGNDGNGNPWNTDSRAYIAAFKTLKSAQGGGGYVSSDYTADEAWYYTLPSVISSGTYTLSASVSPSIVQQQAVFSLFDYDTVNTRSTIALRTSAGGFKPAVWDSSNSWLMEATPTDISINVFQRLTGVWDATANERRYYLNGTLTNTDAGFTPLTTLDTVYVGAEDKHYAESSQATISFAYVREGVLSSDWIATEYAMVNNPSAFLVASEIITSGNDPYTMLNVDEHLNANSVSVGQVLSWNGSDYAWVAQSGGSYADSDVDTHLNTSAATSNQVLSWNGSDYAWVAQSGGSGGSYGDTDVASYLGTLDASIIPDTNSVYDLGSAEKKFRHLYLSSNTMYIGDDTVTVSGGNLTLNDSAIATQSYVSTQVAGVNNQPAGTLLTGTVNDMNAVNTTSLGNIHGDALNKPVDIKGITRGTWGQTMTIAGNGGNTMAQLAFDYGGNGIFWRGGSRDWTTQEPTWGNFQQILTTNDDVIHGKGNITDLNAVDSAGMHFITTGAANMPTTDVQYGQLLTVHGSGDTYWQMVASYSGDDLWFRAGNPDQVGGNGTWNTWRRALVSEATGYWEAVNLNMEVMSLRLHAGYDASLTSTQHALQIGQDTGGHLIMDANEIMARGPIGTAATLALNAEGGDVTVNGSSVVTAANLKTKLGTTLDTVTKLRIFSGADLSLTGDGHGFQVGNTGATNIAMDNNEIMARNNGAASVLYMQLDGGNIEIGGNTTGTLVKVNGNRVYHEGNVDDVLLPDIQGKVGLAQWVRVYAGATGQTFTSTNGSEVLELTVAAEDDLNGWDSTNFWYEVPSVLNGAVADITVNLAAASAASSSTNRVSLKIEVSNNAGVNWIPVASTATFDYWGQGAISGKAKVSTGSLIRAKVGFPDQATRQIQYGSSVSMNIAFFK